MKKIINFVIPITLLFLYTIFFIRKIFLKDFIMYGEEQGFLNYDFVNYRYKSVWNITENFGSISTSFFSRYTMGSIWKSAYYIGLNQLQAQQFCYLIIVFLTLFFTYLIFLHISKNKIFAFITSLIYISTYYYFSIITTSPKLIHYLIIPMSLFFWIKFENSGKIRFYLLNTIFLIFLLGIGINLPQLIGSYSFIFIYILIFSLKRNNIPKIVYFLSSYILTSVYVGFIYLISILRSADLYRETLFIPIWSATSSYIHDIVRFFGGWFDYTGAYDIFYNQLYYYYHSSLGIIFTYIPFTLILLISTFSKEKFSKIAKVLLLILIFIFISKGSALPFHFIFDSIYKVNIFKIFREPWAKFIPNTIFSIILGLNILFKNRQKNIKYYITFILLIFLIFQIIPVVAEKAAVHANYSWRFTDVKIPNYWIDIYNWSKKYLKNKRVLVLPIDSDLNSSYRTNWKPINYIGKPENFFLYSNIISSQFSTFEDKKIMINYLNNLNPNILSLGSIDYVLYKNDSIKNSNTKTVIEKLLPSLDIKNKITFGALDLYPIKKEYLQPKIRTINALIPVKNSCNYSKYSKNQILNNITFLDIKNNNNFNITNVKTNITKIDDTTYRVNFENLINSKNNVGILFTSTFNEGWKIYSSNSLFTNPIISEKNHFPANCFSNLWIIPSTIINNNKFIYIKYQPQILYEIISYLYFGSLIFLVILGLIIKNRYENSKNN